MDVKFKGIVGNIYQKFEAVCQEVDDIVSKVTFHSFFFSCSLCSLASNQKDKRDPVTEKRNIVFLLLPLSQLQLISLGQDST